MREHAMRKSLLTLSTLLLATACGQSADDGPLGSLEQGIVNGTPSEPSDDATVYVLTHPAEGDAVFCTGTLIAPNLVVTALHCVTHSTVGFFTCNPDGSLVVTDRADGKIGPLLEPEDIDIYVGPTIIGASPVASGSQLLGTGSTQICRGDIAFLVLDGPVDAPIASVRLSSGVKTGDTLRVLGYGETETFGDSGRHFRDGARVVDVGPKSEDERSISASPRTFVINEGPCHGDSGGPAFLANGGPLVGVYSLTAGQSCTGVGIRNVYSSLSLYSSLALDAFTAAGAEPLLDEAPAPPEVPPLVEESGCSLGRGGTNAAGVSTGLLALVVLALRTVSRRRARSH
jgi:hypothetical protein